MANRYLHAKLVDHVVVRPFVPADALGVVNLLYKTYGFTYRGAEGAYDPEQLAAHFAGKDAISFVATDVSGRIAGFVGLILRGDGEAEIEALSVDPEVRRGHVARRLAEVMSAESRARAPKVVTSVVTRHPLAQRTVIPFGFLPCALEVAVHPPDLAFRGLDKPGDRPRETFLCGAMFSERRRFPVYLPPRHAGAIREIYALHGLERDAQDPARGPPLGAASEVEIDLRETWLSARIDVRVPGKDLVERLDAVKNDLFDGFIEHIELRLPLAHPFVASPELEQVEALGFFFSGIDPSLSGADRLRLTALARPVDFSILKIEPIAQPLARYVESCIPARLLARPAAAPEASLGNEVMRRLSAGLSHEINNPLNIILGSTYYLKQRLREGKPVEADEQLRSIEAEVSRIAKLLENLQRYANPERAAALALDVERPLGDAVALVEGLAKARGVSIARRFAGGLPPVRGDAPQLEQIFVQLLLNALDASPGGGEVAVETRREGGEVRVTVRDRGLGIPAEDLPHVFEPFFTKKDPGQGTGLGLSIARALAQAHGGDVEIESRPGEGTLARVRLPAAPDGAANGGAGGLRVGNGQWPEMKVIR